MLQTFFVIKPNNINLKYLTGLLNSKLIAYWLLKEGKMQGDNYQIDKEPILNLPLLKPKKDIENYISKLVDKIYSVTSLKSINPSEIEMYETQIDVIVYKMYELNYSDVLTIDKDFKLSEKEYNEYKLN